MQNKIREWSDRRLRMLPHLTCKLPYTPWPEARKEPIEACQQAGTCTGEDGAAVFHHYHGWKADIHGRLQGKVVLVDFWATWCVPCREALPHIREVAKKFQGQPLVILSVSLDSDEQKWKEIIGKNEMTWPQYRDGSFNGPVAKMFAVTAIPRAFTIDGDGVLQEEHIGDASVEGETTHPCPRSAINRKPGEVRIRIGFGILNSGRWPAAI